LNRDDVAKPYGPVLGRRRRRKGHAGRTPPRWAWARRPTPRGDTWAGCLSSLPITRPATLLARSPTERPAGPGSLVNLPGAPSIRRRNDSPVPPPAQGSRSCWPCGASPGASPQPPQTTSPASRKAISAGDPQAAARCCRQPTTSGAFSPPTAWLTQPRGDHSSPPPSFRLGGLPPPRPCLRSRRPGPAPALLRRRPSQAPPPRRKRPPPGTPKRKKENS
jgi:hypothetical protein